jgi:hypothetical protein
MGQIQSAQSDTNGRGGTYSPESDVSATAEALREIVLRHCVCYEVWPEWSANGGRATRIGFTISLCGIHENDPGQNNVPGCGLCWGTYSALRTIAERILPKEERACRFEVGAFDRAWHVAPSARQGRNETVVPIRIFHRHNVHAPVDDCQQQCLNEMRERLHGLGIRENVWSA